MEALLLFENTVNVNGVSHFLLNAMPQYDVIAITADGSRDTSDDWCHSANAESSGKALVSVSVFPKFVASMSHIPRSVFAQLLAEAPLQSIAIGAAVARFRPFEHRFHALVCLLQFVFYGTALCRRVIVLNVKNSQVL